MYLFLCGGFSLVISCFILVTCGQTDSGYSTADPPGHNLPFGSHTEPFDVIEMQEFPVPTEFYQEYLKKSRPFIVRSILNELTFPAVVKWTDEYFRKELGPEVIVAEQKKKEERNQPPAQMPLSQFLDLYKDRELYMVHGLDMIRDSDRKKKLLDDIYLPRCLSCGGLQYSVDSLIMWFSSGGTKSVLHFDDFDNFNCVLDGNKELVFADQIYREQIETVGFHDDGSFSEMDVDKVDMHRFSRIPEVPVYKAKLSKGDCLYIPYKWYHQVNSPGGRSLALNFWFVHSLWFNETDCENKELRQQTEPISRYSISHEAYVGWGKFVSEFFLFHEAEISLSQFADVIENNVIELHPYTQQLFERIDKDGSSTVNLTEFYVVDPRNITKEFPDIISFSKSQDASSGIHDEL